MEITFYGQSFFDLAIKNQSGQNVRLVIDPFDEGIGLNVPSLSADIALISHNHPDHANLNVFSNKPFIVATLGEFEIKEVSVRGLPAFHDDTLGKEKGSIIIFKIELDGLRLCHLSDLGQKELTNEQVEEIGEVDILFCPVGGNYTISAKEAGHIISQIEPRIVIPMHYQLPNLKLELDGLDKFLKQMGQEDAEKTKKLKITAKNLPLEETKIIVLEP